LHSSRAYLQFLFVLVHRIALCLKFVILNVGFFFFTLKRFNFIIAYIFSITKRIYLQVSKKRKKENKKGSFLSIKYARSVYLRIVRLRSLASNRNCVSFRFGDRFSGQIRISSLLDPVQQLRRFLVLLRAVKRIRFHLCSDRLAILIALW